MCQKCLLWVCLFWLHPQLMSLGHRCRCWIDVFEKQSSGTEHRPSGLVMWNPSTKTIIKYIKYSEYVVLGCTGLSRAACVWLCGAQQLLTGYSWDQPQGSQHTEGSKGFNIKSTWLTPVPVHWRMVTFSLTISLLLFGQKLQDNTEESVRKQKERTSISLPRIISACLNWHVVHFMFQKILISCLVHFQGWKWQIFSGSSFQMRGCVIFIRHIWFQTESLWALAWKSDKTNLHVTFRSGKL